VGLKWVRGTSVRPSMAPSFLSRLDKVPQSAVSTLLRHFALPTRGNRQRRLGGVNRP
jgi:hypothetical protein